MVRKLTENDYSKMIELVKRTFNEFVAKDYCEEGINEFNTYVSSLEKLNELDIWGYYIGERLIGVIATRDEMSHISLFFVDKDFQRKSFGKKLLETVVNETSASVLSVHSSPCSVSAYKYMGFVATDKMLEENGIKYVPMELKVNKNKKDSNEMSMAELLNQENIQIKLDKEEKERNAAEEEELFNQQKEQKHQLYLEMKEQRHQEYLEMKERKHQEYLEMKERKRLEWEAEKERRANTFEDKTLTCKKCGKEWIFTAAEQKFFKEKGFFRPSMCKECRASIKTINNFHK